MKNVTTILSLVSLTLFLTSACDSLARISGSGNVIEESRDVSGFQKVSISGSGRLFINQGEKEILQIECDDNIMPYIRSVVSDGTLKIGPKSARLKPSRPIEYRLFLIHLDALRTSGSVLVESDALTTESLEVVISGSGTFRVKGLETRSVTFDISGSGEVRIESGSSRNQTISISGSGRFNVPNLKTENTDIRISGSGSAKVWATDKLNIKISGSGKLDYYGSPVISARISGSGKVGSLGMK